MKTLNNTVIANIKKGDWEIIKKYFEDRGVDTGRCEGKILDCCYGVIRGKFNVYEDFEVQQANATILEVGDIVSDTVTLPKSFVIEAHKEACIDWKKRIEEVVPELFPKNELEGWYRTTEYENEKWLMFFENGLAIYGFDGFGVWTEKERPSYKGDGTEIPATEQEVFEALKAEAVKRGFKEGVKYNCKGVRGRNDNVKCGSIEVAKESKFGSIGLFCTNNGWIYDKGRWAEIISIPTEIQSLIDKYGKEKLMQYCTT